MQLIILCILEFKSEEGKQKREKGGSHEKIITSQGIYRNPISKKDVVNLQPATMTKNLLRVHAAEQIGASVIL